MRVVRLVAVLVVVAVLGLGGWWYLFARDSNKSRFRTAVAERGELLATINATGTIEAEENIDIGAQVQGKIEKFGPDPKAPKKTIDYVNRILTVERDIVISSQPLEATELHVDNIRWTYVFYESGLSINVLYTIDDDTYVVFFRVPFLCARMAASHEAAMIRSLVASRS